MSWLLLGEAEPEENSAAAPPTQARFTDVFSQVLRHAEQVQALTISGDVYNPELKRFGILMYNVLYREDYDASILLDGKSPHTDPK